MGASPAKKIDFTAANKENVSQDAGVAEKSLDPKAATVDAINKDPLKPTVAAGIKDEESDEPLLQENPHRFVLFPIKYHEVCHVLLRCLCPHRAR